MTTTIPGLLTGLFTILVVVVPIYYVVFRHRFAFAFFMTWLLMVAAQQASIAHSHQLYNQGLLRGSPADTTSVGLTVFSGWLLSYPYCGVLFLIRLYLVRYKFLASEVGAKPLTKIKPK